MRNTRNKAFRVIPTTRSGAAPPLQGPEEVLGISPRATKEEILAAHADQSLALISDATALEREILSSFRFQENRAVALLLILDKYMFFSKYTFLTFQNDGISSHLGP